MPTTDSLGTCPDCNARVPALNALIRYEKGTDTTAVFAECPSCSDVVYFE